MGRKLREIFESNQTSKGTVGFDALYEEVIGPRRAEPLRLLEIGIFKGHSLQAWLEYCPEAAVTGIDTFERVPPDEVPVLKDSRVVWYRQSSAGPIPPDIGVFDFIIDDGCHWHAAQRMTFHRYWPTLKTGGSYFIEDVWPFDLMTAEDKRHPWLEDHPGAWSDEAFADLLRAVSVGTVLRHDFRASSGIPNSDRYIIEVRK